MDPEEIMTEYAKAYHTLYEREPSELRDLGEDWVLVNGAQMTVSELEQLTLQLKQEILAAREAKRGIVKRLMKWFTTAS